MTRATTLVVAALLLGWMLFLRPSSVLGGSTGYVVVHGNSMLPNLHNGDLVVSRTGDHYAVGEVVAYHVPRGQLGQGLLVIHRVVGQRADHTFTLRGDNNPTDDPWHPGVADVGGAVRLRIPKAGGMLLALRKPPVTAVLGAVLAVWLVWRRERVLDRLERLYPSAWDDGPKATPLRGDGQPAWELRSRLPAHWRPERFAPAPELPRPTTR